MTTSADNNSFLVVRKEPQGDWSVVTALSSFDAAVERVKQNNALSDFDGSGFVHSVAVYKEGYLIYLPV